MGLPGSGGDAVLKPQNLSAVGCTAGLGEGGILFGDQVCHPLERFSRRIFPRPRAAVSFHLATDTGLEFSANCLHLLGRIPDR